MQAVRIALEVRVVVAETSARIELVDRRAARFAEKQFRDRPIVDACTGVFRGESRSAASCGRVLPRRSSNPPFMDSTVRPSIGMRSRVPDRLPTALGTLAVAFDPLPAVATGAASIVDRFAGTGIDGARTTVSATGSTGRGGPYVRSRQSTRAS
jgi:hypothetical protein